MNAFRLFVGCDQSAMAETRAWGDQSRISDAKLFVAVNLCDAAALNVKTTLTHLFQLQKGYVGLCAAHPPRHHPLPSPLHSFPKLWALERGWILYTDMMQRSHRV